MLRKFEAHVFSGAAERRSEELQVAKGQLETDCTELKVKATEIESSLRNSLTCLQEEAQTQSTQFKVKLLSLSE